MRIVIADDDALVREGLKLILETVEGFDVAALASNGQEAVALCGSVRPDIVLMDIRMPVMDGVQATRQIKQQFENIKVLLLTTFNDTQYIRSAVQFGADGYILKSNSSDSIIESIRAVYKGNVVYEKQIAKALSGMVPKDCKISPQQAGITQRELDTMKYIAEGLSNREISERLFISEGTVRNLISALLTKLNLKDRTQLAVHYIRKLEQ